MFTIIFTDGVDSYSLKISNIRTQFVQQYPNHHIPDVLVVQNLDEVYFCWSEEQQRLSLRPGPGRAAHSVDVVGRAGRGLELHDPLNVGQIQTAGGYVLGEEVHIMKQSYKIIGMKNNVLDIFFCK